MNFTKFRNVFLTPLLSSLEGSPDYVNADGLIDTGVIETAVFIASDILEKGGSESVAKSSALAILIIGLKKCNNLPVELEKNVTKDAFAAASVVIDAIASKIEQAKIILLVLRTFESKGYRFISLNTNTEQFKVSKVRSILKANATPNEQPSDNESTTALIASVSSDTPTGPKPCISFRDAIMSTVDSDDLFTIGTSSEETESNNSTSNNDINDSDFNFIDNSDTSSIEHSATTATSCTKLGTSYNLMPVSKSDERDECDSRVESYDDNEKRKECKKISRSIPTDQKQPTVEAIARVLDSLDFSELDM